MFASLRRTFWILLGFALIVLLVWWAGPYFSFAGYVPLETPTARLIAIAVVVGCWVIVRLVKRLRTFRISDRLLGAVVAQPQPEAARPSGDAVKLRERFEESVAILRQQRRSGHTLYELPWYVIIGAPGSGKTTALLNSGLTFPLEQRVGKGALRGVGGTRNCDWWFTDEAVFLDTAGRYTTQDSDPTSDGAGWSEFLALLRKYRARRPINGVILTLNAQEVIVQNAAAREVHVEAARRRLDELNRELGIQIPVYLMVTKCDLVDGFAEYFDDLTADGRRQVWGVTFPYEQTLASEPPLTFPEEFDALMARLNERVFGRVEDVREPRRRTRVFAFPQQMAATRDALTEFVTEVFGSSQYESRILLRGVYFTSGTQHGTPIDRLLGSMGRRFGAVDAVLPSSGPGKAYFVEQLLKGVMIGESGLAGLNRRLEARKALVQLGAYVGAGVIAAAGLAALSVSYTGNRGFLEQIQTGVTALEQVPTVTPASPMERIVPRLDAIRAIVDSSDRYRDSTWVVMRWGLYQGRSIGGSAHEAYRRELEGILLPRLAAQIRIRLTESSQDPGGLLDYLKAYRMLNSSKRLDKSHLRMVAEREWASTSGRQSRAPDVSTHVEALLEGSDPLPTLAIEGALVTQGCNNLEQASMARILYEGIKRTHAAGDGPGLKIDASGLDVAKVFRRRSGVRLSTPIPALFTRDVFKKITSAANRVDLGKQLAADSWVCDETTAARLQAVSLVTGVTTLYEQDYIREWEALLNDLEFQRFETIAQLNEALRILVSQTSPLRGVLEVVRRNTTLVETPAASAPPGVVDRVTKGVTDRFGSLTKTFKDAAGLLPTEPGTLVTQRFRWIRDLMKGNPDKPAIDEIIDSMRAIQQLLDRLGPGAASGDPLDMLANPTFRELARALQRQAAALPPGLQTLVSEIADAPGAVVAAGATGDLERIYKQTVVAECVRAISNRYPFAPGAQMDVPLDDFAKVFGYGGVYDRFYKEHLETLVDASGTPWAWRPDSVHPSTPILGKVQAAFQLRERFFPDASRTPEVNFVITMGDADRDVRRFVLQINGKNFDTTPGRQFVSDATWPGTLNGPTSTSLDAAAYDPPLYKSGAWAWFRLIDEELDRSSAGQRRLHLIARSRDGGHQASIWVESQRDYNPFSDQTWRQFTCES